MVYSSYQKQRICSSPLKASNPIYTIAKRLHEEGLVASRQGISKLKKRYCETGTIVIKPGSGCPSKVTSEIQATVEQQMRDDDETIAVHCTPYRW